VGGIAPLLTILLLPSHLKIPLTFVAVLIALAATGYTSAHVAYSPYLKAMTRNVIGGASAMAITYGIGLLVGGAVTV
jgi:VIT1/CCC1 family predicted Fe2+/Mn2+ transporter